MAKISPRLLVLLLVSSALAQNLPEAPSHSFWDTPNRFLFAMDIAAKAADFSATHHNLSHGGIELNPVARPLCKRGTAGQLVFFGGHGAAALAVAYLLHRAGHHKLERGFMLINIADSATGAGYSFAHR